MKSYNIKDERYFKVLGSIALNEPGFKRVLNDDIKSLEKININAARHAYDSAGIQVRFKTNSKKINIKVSLKVKSNMNNMSSLGQSGVDIYIYHKSLKKYVFLKSTPYDQKLSTYEFELVNNPKKEFHEYILNLPLYNSILDLELFLDSDATIIPYTKHNDNNIIFYGSSIVQGGTASRAGLLYTNIISRQIDNEIFNFGFSASAFLETEMAEIISKVKNPEILVIDAEPNAGVDNKLKDNLEDFIKVFRNHHKETKILVCSKISYSFEYLDLEAVNRNDSNKNFMIDLVNKLRKTDPNIYFVDGYDVFGKDFYEYTVDGVHPNDLGAYKLAEFYLNELLKYLK